MNVAQFSFEDPELLRNLSLLWGPAQATAGFSPPLPGNPPTQAPSEVGAGVPSCP